MTNNLPPIPRKVRRLLDTAAAVVADPPDRMDFLHAVLCQVGLPRSRTDASTFERSSGNVSILVEAGKLWQRGHWIEHPLPYGSRPRLTMIHVSSEAIRTRSREIDVGHSIREFLLTLGLDTGGHEYGRFKKQIEALAACRMSIGMTADGRDVTVKTQPISRFEAWLHPTGDQAVMWPGVLELSQEFYDTLTDHAVPLDYRALAALKGSALQLDVYTWLSHRLHRIRAGAGVVISWSALRDQFGQEYRAPKDFKREFQKALRAVAAVYPGARLEDMPGTGIKLLPSPPPVPKARVAGRLGR